MTIYDRALEFVRDGDVVGLGSGRAASAFIEALARRSQQGLRVAGVPTSRKSEELARGLGLPVASLEGNVPLALTVDGADEVDLDLNLIKGWGRALVREKVVAAASRKLVILVGKQKVVPALGSRGRLPVEVVPLALPLVRARAAELGLNPVPFEQDGRLFVTDNGNHILDCGTGPIDDPSRLEQQLRAVPGVVGTGLFLGMASTVLIGDEARDFELIEERRAGDDVGDQGP
ncbi:MAG: ribose-5-phosphate isomerase RpiA [Gemmataceae bacterium]